jgi:hypothetical protein
MPVHTAIREKNSLEEIILALTCNACGKTEPVEPDGRGYPYGFHILRLGGGYGDNFPGDTETFEIVACEDCLRKWVGTFTHPDVSQGSAIWGESPYKVKHCETLEEHIVEGGWIRPADTDYPAGLPEATFPDGDYPSGGVWEHFKNRRYVIRGVDQLVGTAEHFVVYQALYGESEIWIRPLTEWYDEIDRETYKGPRFRKVD